MGINKNVKKINYKNISGITIISLVITIIVLIILAGVTIDILFENNGIIKNAIYKKFVSEITQLQEQIEIKQLALKLNNQNDYFGTINKLLNENNKYNDKLIVLNGELRYIDSQFSSEELQWLNQLGIQPASDYYIVKFDANGGQIDIESKTVICNEGYGSLPTPTREGYTFKGWNGKNKFDKSKYLKLEDYNLSTNFYNWANIQLKPNTEYKISVIRYNGFDGRNNGELIINKVPSPAAKDYWSAIAHSTAPNKTYTDYKYTLNDDGVLYLGASKNTVSQSNLDNIWTNTDLQIEEGNAATAYEPYYITSDTIVVQTQNHTLIAIWEPISSTITFNTNGGTGGTTSAVVKYGEELPTIVTPTKAGYTFAGYSENVTENLHYVLSYQDSSNKSKLNRIHLGTTIDWNFSNPEKDIGTRLIGKVTIEDSTITKNPTLDFNDSKVTSDEYSVVHTGDTYIIYFDFIIDENNLTHDGLYDSLNTSYATAWRFLDLNGITSNSQVTVNYLMKSNGSYYNSIGEGIKNVDFTQDIDLYAIWKEDE